MNFNEYLLTIPDMLHLQAASESKVQEAEQALVVSFATEYKEYLLSFGVAIAGSHEFTGICDSPRLNVVDVTKKQRKYYGHGCDAMYVVEQENIDNIVIWQNHDGQVFRSFPGVQPELIAPSLVDYLSSELL